MRLLVPGLLLGGSLLAIALGATLAEPTGASGVLSDGHGEVARWRVQEELVGPGELAWTVILELPGEAPDYLYDTDSGDLVHFPTLDEARDFAVGFLEGSGYGA